VGELPLVVDEGLADAITGITGIFLIAGFASTIVLPSFRT
jgi:hypothetical protein